MFPMIYKIKTQNHETKSESRDVEHAGSSVLDVVVCIVYP